MSKPRLGSIKGIWSSKDLDKKRRQAQCKCGMMNQIRLASGNFYLIIKTTGAGQLDIVHCSETDLLRVDLIQHVDMNKL